MSKDETQITSVNLVWIGWVIVSTVIVLLLSLSPVRTAYVDFFLSKFFFIPLIIAIGVTWLKRETNISLFPMGQIDTDTYPVQKRFGYDVAIYASIIFAVFFALFIANDILTTQELYLPVNPIFVTGVRNQVFAESTVDVFTGQAGILSGLAAAIPASLLEDSLAIVVTMVFAMGLRFGIVKFAGIPEEIASWVGVGTFALLYPFIFSFIFHSFAYGASDAAFNRVFIFGLLGGGVTMATGFALPIVLGHLTNNYLAATMNILGKGQLSVVEAGVPFIADLVIVTGLWLYVMPKVTNSFGSFIGRNLK